MVTEESPLRPGPWIEVHRQRRNGVLTAVAWDLDHEPTMLQVGVGEPGQETVIAEFPPMGAKGEVYLGYQVQPGTVRAGDRLSARTWGQGPEVAKGTARVHLETGEEMDTVGAVDLSAGQAALEHPTVCVKCRHYRTSGSYPKRRIWYNLLCGKRPRQAAVDPVTGIPEYLVALTADGYATSENQYPYCRDINHGACADYEAPEAAQHAKG